MRQIIAISEQARDENYMRGAAEVYTERAKREFEAVLAAAAAAPTERAMRTIEAVLGTLEMAKENLLAGRA